MVCDRVNPVSTRGDAETQGYPLMFPLFYAFLFPSFSQVHAGSCFMIPVFPRISRPRSFTFLRSLGCRFVSDTGFTFVLPGIFHLFQHDYFFSCRFLLIRKGGSFVYQVFHSIPFIFLVSLAFTRVHVKHAGDGISAWEMPILQLVSTAKGPSSREP